MFRESVKRFVKGGRETAGDKEQACAYEKMEVFQREIVKALWHVFDMLDTNKTGLVHVSQLKVITSTLGRNLGFDKAEEMLNKDAVSDMDFKTYCTVIKTELIDKLEEHETNLGGKVHGNRLNDIIKTCWKFCNFDIKYKSTSFTTEHCWLLWRLFNTLSEIDANGNPVFPVVLDPEEANILMKEFINITGQKSMETLIKQFVDGMNDVALSFVEFLDVFQKGCVENLSHSDITHGLNKLHDTYILNVLAKGLLWKRSPKVKNWKERWLVLTPTQLRYFISCNEKVQKGSIDFGSDCSIEVIADRPTSKRHRFVIQTSKKHYEISAPDLKTKNEWVSSLQLAFSRIGQDPNIQYEVARERSAARAARRRLKADEEKRRKEEAELFQRQQNELNEEKRKRLQDEELLKHRLSELEEERKRREDAEARVKEEQHLRELEHERLRELKKMKLELERLLAEQRQAKENEERVRNLQAKLLKEELEKRKELERLKQQQEEILKAEREQKAVLETDKMEQARLLMEAKLKLKQLEKDQADASARMQEATEKLQRLENDRQIMEAKEKLWKTPIGLARIIEPKVDPYITHRGKGAFCDKDFEKRASFDEMEAAHCSSNHGIQYNYFNVTDANVENFNENTAEVGDLRSANRHKVRADYVNCVIGSGLSETEDVS